MFGGVIFDLDGTVYRGTEALPGARETIRACRGAGIRPLFFSNNPTKSATAYVERLDGMGIDATAAEVRSAGSVTTAFLAAHYPDAAHFVVGTEGLVDQLEAADLRVIDDAEAADVVVGSWDDGFDYGTMVGVLRGLDDETTFVGTDPDRVIPAGDGEFAPGSGAIINAITGVTDREPDRILGKPSPEAVDAALTALDCEPEDVLVVGDRLDTDIALGERAGMTTALVLSGVTERADLEGSEVSPDHVLDGIADVPSLLDAV